MWSAAPDRASIAAMDTTVGITGKLPVEISDWKPAPFGLLGETVFAIGDIHGCADELRALLGTIGELARQSSGKRRLVYLGDMINRGPDSMGVLELWAADEAAHGVDHIDRLMGNHEIMMMLAVIGGPHAQKAEAMWLSKRMGGQALLDQMRARADAPAVPVGQALIETALGELPSLDIKTAVMTWARESQKDAREVAYKGVGDHGDTDLGSDYIRDARAVVRQRLAQAGVRLAALRNQSLK